MRKVILPIVVLVALVFVVYIIVIKKQEDKHQKAAPISVNTGDSLTGSVGAALQAYYNLKDAFIKSDSLLVNRNAGVFADKLSSINSSDIKGDTAIIELTKQLKDNLISGTNSIISAGELESKRKNFQVVSDGLFDLLRSIGYNSSKVYQLYCPMAFDNAGAAWLSDSREIVNPYFGEKMLHCGDLRDSVNIQQ